MHAAGKTEEARAGLARFVYLHSFNKEAIKYLRVLCYRLAITRKQREEAAKKREEERIGDYLMLLHHDWLTLYFKWV